MVLSIVIPSYNRFEKLVVTVESILKAKSEDFEVYIIDNNSDNDIYDYIKFNDPRLHIIKRNQAVSGIENCTQAFKYGEGEFVMLLLDKDFLSGMYLDRFIEILTANKHVTVGHCVLNQADFEEENILIKTNILEKMGYSYAHPSGVFIRRDAIQEECERNGGDLKAGPFAPDMMKARAMTCGDYLIFQLPMVHTESKEDSAKTKSYSYSGLNVYFLPDNVCKRYWDSVNHLNTLSTTIDVLKQVHKKLFIEALNDITLMYAQFMMDKDVCKHYGLNTKKVSLGELFHNIGILKRMEFRISKICPQIRIRLISIIRYIIKTDLRCIKYILKTN